MIVFFPSRVPCWPVCFGRGVDCLFDIPYTVRLLAVTFVTVSHRRTLELCPAKKQRCLISSNFTSFARHSNLFLRLSDCVSGLELKLGTVPPSAPIIFIIIRLWHFGRTRQVEMSPCTRGYPRSAKNTANREDFNTLDITCCQDGETPGYRAVPAG